MIKVKMPWTKEKNENLNGPINENTTSPFQCYHCTLGTYSHYYLTYEEYVRHMIDEHPEEWPVQIKTSTQKPKWLREDLLGAKVTLEQQKSIRAAYLQKRATSDVGIAVYVDAHGATSYDRSESPEPLQYTHVRAMNHALKVSGRNEGCVRGVLNGNYGSLGKTLLGMNDPKNVDNSICELTNKAVVDIKNLRRRQGLVGNGNTPQLDKQYPEDKLSKYQTEHLKHSTSHDLEPTATQLKARFLSGSYYAIQAKKKDPNATADMQYKCKLCHDFFNASGRSLHWQQGCTPVTEKAQVITEELTIPTAVVDIPDVKDNSSFWDLVDNTPEMNWTTFSETLGTNVFQKYLTLEDENKQLVTANLELNQKIEELTTTLMEKEKFIKEMDDYTSGKTSTSKDSNEEPLPSNKAEVLQGIQNAGRASAQEILRKHTGNKNT